MFPWLAMMALYQEQEEEAQEIAQGHEGMESLFPIQSTHSPSQRPAWAAPVGPNLQSCAQCQSLHPSDNAHEGLNTSTVTAGAGIAHGHLSNFKKGLFNMIFPPLPEICKPENAVLISPPGRNMIRD